MNARHVCMLGGTGFVGEHLVARLHNQGIRSRILTRHPERHRALKVLPGLRLIEADLFDPESLARNFEGCGAVINLVGILNESGSQETFRRIHVELVEGILDACRTAGVERLLHMSALNAHATNGPSAYLRSKGKAEDLVHRADPPLRVTSFRPSVIFGPGDGFFNRFAQLLRVSPGVFPLACPETRFAPVYVGDVCTAIGVSLDNPATWGKHFDLCGPQSFSLKDLIEYTARIIGRRTLVLGLNDSLSRLQARVFQHLPGKPFTFDNYLSMQVHSVCTHNGLDDLRIVPTPLDAVVPGYL